MNVDDVGLVRIDYEREDGLRARRSVYGDATVRGAIGEVSPERVLEVGSGSGDFAVRARDKLGAKTVASGAHKHLADRVPEFEGSLSATCANAIFVAERAV